MVYTSTYIYIHDKQTERTTINPHFVQAEKDMNMHRRIHRQIHSRTNKEIGRERQTQTNSGEQMKWTDYYRSVKEKRKTKETEIA